MNDRAILVARVEAVALVVLSAITIAVFFVPSPAEMNCLHVSMDIAAGRVRYERYVLLVKVRDTVDEGGLYALYCELFPDRPPPMWRRVLTEPKGIVGLTAHGRYLSSLNGARWLLQCFEDRPFSDDAKREAVGTFLHLLQADDSCYRAGEYVSEVCAVADERAATEVQVSDLPQPPD